MIGVDELLFDRFLGRMLRRSQYLRMRGLGCTAQSPPSTSLSPSNISLRTERLKSPARPPSGRCRPGPGLGPRWRRVRPAVWEKSIFILTNLKYFRGRALILNGLDKLCFRLLSRISVGTFKIKTKKLPRRLLLSFHLFSAKSDRKHNKMWDMERSHLFSIPCNEILNK